LNYPEYLIKKFKDKKCDLLGYGRSNKPLAEMLLSAGARVTFRDRNDGLLSDASALEFMRKGIDFCVGDCYLDSLDGDFIFRTPGIRHDLPEIAEAVRNGAVLTSEMELFFEVCPATIIGITGSDGKTTTTTLTHLFLQKEGEKRGFKAFVGGNIGAPLLPFVSEMTENDFAIVELSSFQLQTMKTSPKRAVITNITPNHLNWHTDMDEYITAKCNICRHRGAEVLVANAENAVTREIAKNSDLPITYFSSAKSSYSEIVPFFKENCSAVYACDGVVYLDDGKRREAIVAVSDILLPGVHNLENYMTAIAVTYPFVSKETVVEVAKTFGGVPHRLELVREMRGVRYYNSSIDSSPTRTAAALRALDKAPIIICGGSEKNIPYDTLALDLCERVKSVVLTGQSAQNIFAALKACPEYSSERLKVEHIPDFCEAVTYASSMAEEGDIVLLSPACASFDRFKDFEERGNYFKRIVNGLE